MWSSESEEIGGNSGNTAEACCMCSVLYTHVLQVAVRCFISRRFKQISVLHCGSLALGPLGFSG